MSETGSTTLYHPTGARCLLPLPIDPQEAFDAVNSYLAVGFQVTAPVEKEGLERKNIDFVVRCKFEYEGKVKERLYFYDTQSGSKFTGSAMSVYPDDPEKLAAFERAAGFTLASMPFMNGKVAPQTDSRDFEALARPVSFTVSCEFEAPSKKYSTGRYLLVEYVGFGKPSAMPSSAPKTALISTDKQTPYQIAIEWAKGKGYDTARYPYPNNHESEIVAKEWCLAIEKQQGKVEATG